jgi:hypothetical protein
MLALQCQAETTTQRWGGGGGCCNAVIKYLQIKFKKIKFIVEKATGDLAFYQKLRIYNL